jgi:hypothetical protein
LGLAAVAHNILSQTLAVLTNGRFHEENCQHA